MNQPDSSKEKRWVIEKWGSHPQAGAIDGPETNRIEVVPTDHPGLLSQEDKERLRDLADRLASPPTGKPPAYPDDLAFLRRIAGEQGEEKR